jgi:hypothetical protein
VTDGFNNIRHCSLVAFFAPGWDNGCGVVWGEGGGRWERVRTGKAIHFICVNVEDGLCVGKDPRGMRYMVGETEAHVLGDGRRAIDAVDCFESSEQERRESAGDVGQRAEVQRRRLVMRCRIRRPVRRRWRYHFNRGSVARC